ncbi:hypothetical protein AK812_SmicGene6200 [Symbiodinium microadriaticum]|uniref:F-box domain-containing protein n=1 Tax=Symbiodinium microadriaticum TaxID=2951 RepID=A0A1Q9ERU7_SYMMI|nr:hypothetical protein AK812_SmicGene6200 [Symbiodinium microadriaticum]
MPWEMRQALLGIVYLSLHGAASEECGPHLPAECDAAPLLQLPKRNASLPARSLGGVLVARFQDVVDKIDLSAARSRKLADNRKDKQEWPFSPANFTDVPVTTLREPLTSEQKKLRRKVLARQAVTAAGLIMALMTFSVGMQLVMVEFVMTGTCEMPFNIAGTVGTVILGVIAGFRWLFHVPYRLLRSLCQHCSCLFCHCCLRRPDPTKAAMPLQQLCPDHLLEEVVGFLPIESLSTLSYRLSPALRSALHYRWSRQMIGRLFCSLMLCFEAPGGVEGWRDAAMPLQQLCPDHLLEEVVGFLPIESLSTLSYRLSPALRSALHYRWSRQMIGRLFCSLMLCFEAPGGVEGWRDVPRFHFRRYTRTMENAPAMETQTAATEQPADAALPAAETAAEAPDLPAPNDQFVMFYDAMVDRLPRHHPLVDEKAHLLSRHWNNKGSSMEALMLLIAETGAHDLVWSIGYIIMNLQFKKQHLPWIEDYLHAWLRWLSLATFLLASMALFALSSLLEWFRLLVHVLQMQWEDYAQLMKTKIYHWYAFTNGLIHNWYCFTAQSVEALFQTSSPQSRQMCVDEVLPQRHN